MQRIEVCLVRHEGETDIDMREKARLHILLLGDPVTWWHNELKTRLFATFNMFPGVLTDEGV